MAESEGEGHDEDDGKAHYNYRIPLTNFWVRSNSLPTHKTLRLQRFHILRIPLKKVSERNMQEGEIGWSL